MITDFRGSNRFRSHLCAAILDDYEISSPDSSTVLF